MENFSLFLPSHLGVEQPGNSFILFSVVTGLLLMKLPDKTRRLTSKSRLQDCDGPCSGLYIHYIREKNYVCDIMLCTPASQPTLRMNILPPSSG
jgi:hypothetical protein